MAWQKHQLEWQQKHHSCNDPLLISSMSLVLWWLDDQIGPGKIFGKWSLRNRRMRLRWKSVRLFIGDASRVCFIAICFAKSCPSILQGCEFHHPHINVSMPCDFDRSWLCKINDQGPPKDTRSIVGNLNYWDFFHHLGLNKETHWRPGGRKICPVQAAEVKGSLDIFSVEDWMRTFVDVKGLKVAFIWVFPKIMVPPNHPF